MTRTGRPRRDPKHARISFHVRVHPDTHQFIDRLAKKLKISTGQVLDEMVDRMKAVDEMLEI